jgi:hypothetical protein
MVTRHQDYQQQGRNGKKGRVFGIQTGFGSVPVPVYGKDQQDYGNQGVDDNGDPQKMGNQAPAAEKVF